MVVKEFEDIESTIVVRICILSFVDSSGLKTSMYIKTNFCESVDSTDIFEEGFMLELRLSALDHPLKALSKENCLKGRNLAYI